MEFKFDKVPFLYQEKSLSRSGGETSLCLMTIDPKYKDDKGLYAHEHRHIVHWWICTIISFIAFYFAAPFLGQYTVIFIALPLFVYQLIQEIPKVRLWVEIDCYVAQLKQYKGEHQEKNIKYFAKILSSQYNVNSTEKEVYTLLKKKLGLK